MKKKLTHNLGLKILALLFAVCLWLISININDPVSPNSYTVTVSLQNLKNMTSAGKYVEILDDTDTIRVTVRASRSVFTNFSEKNIVATADLNKITDDDYVPIEISTTKTTDKIESIKADKEYVHVSVENSKKVQVPVEVNVSNEPADGYILGGTSTVQNAVIISGPESVISTIAKAGVEINVDGAKSDVNISLPIHLYDSDGNEVDDAKLSKSVNEVSTTAVILQKKEVPIEYETTGEPLNGYMLTGEIDSTPASVVIAGKASVIKNVSKITVPDAINVTGFDKDIEVIVELKQYLPEGTILVDNQYGGKATATAHIGKKEFKTIELNSTRIKVINLPDGYEASVRGLDETVELTLTGLKEQLDKVKADELNGYIDMQAYMKEENIEKLSEDSYPVSVTFELPEGVFLNAELKVHVDIKSTES